MKSSGDAALLRKVNESAISELIRQQGPVTRAALANQLHLSLPTVTRIVNHLIESRRILECNFAASKGGRRPTLLEFNYRASLIISVYVGHDMMANLADLGGTVLARRKTPSRRGEDGVQDLVNLITDLRQQAKRLKIPVQGICIATPSVVNFPHGIVNWSPALEWRDLPLKERLEAALHLPVVVENEVNLIALGETWRGAGKGVRNLVCISLDAGIGAGLVLEGHLYRGSHGAAGEVGYVIPNVGYLGQVYDEFGCLEDLAGGSAMVRRMAEKKIDSRGPVAPSSPELLSLEQVFLAARAGDPLATEVVAGAVDYLSLAIANLACIIDPDRIVLSGGMADFADLFIEPIRRRIQGILPAETEIIQSDLGIDAAVYGAVLSVMRYTGDAVFVQPSRV